MYCKKNLDPKFHENERTFEKPFSHQNGEMLLCYDQDVSLVLLFLLTFCGELGGTYVVVFTDSK